VTYVKADERNHDPEGIEGGIHNQDLKAAT
jgi:hypothetical protein